jgi:hypothetical protein
MSEMPMGRTNGALAVSASFSPISEGQRRDYTLAHFRQDRTFLIQGDWQAGQQFQDDARNVRIAINSIDGAASLATITIG